MQLPNNAALESANLPEVDFFLSAVNIAEHLDTVLLNQIGAQVVEGYEADRLSRSDWEKKYDNALKLAAQVMEHKNTPWPNAANIKYPLLTTACVQFSARAYPSLVPGPRMVLARVTGDDPEGLKAQRADRLSKHMSYQLLEEMDEWEEDMDRILVMLPCTGTEFKKSYFDPMKGRNVSEHVLARDLVVNYWAKSLETASRKTHVLYLTPNELRERVLSGVYLDNDLKRSNASPDPLRQTSDKIQGITPPNDDEDRPFETLEQHCWWDLDDDGYKEPYIVTVDRDTRKVHRIAARFDQDGVTRRNNKIIRIQPVEYFTKYSFIPSLDGGFYDLGWGHLLSPINETINTTINQLLDAGTLSNQQSGFLSRGIRLRGGDSRMKPGEWKFVESTGDDLRKGIMPLPVREPSQTLFQLLGTMTQAGERLSNVVDILLGENPGQNQPATTTMAVIEQGLKVFTAVYKRLYRSLKREYQKLYRLNRLYLPDEQYFRVIDPDQNTLMRITQSDYKGDPTDVQPASDPNMVSDAQRLMRAQALVTSLKEGSPANPLEVWKRYYEAIRIENPERILPKELPPPPPDPKMVAIEVDSKHQDMQHQLDAAKLQLDQARLQLDQARLQLEESKLAFEQEMERYRASREGGEGTGALEILKLDHQRELSERDHKHQLEIARMQEESKERIEKMKMEFAGNEAKAGRDHEKSMHDSEKETEVTREEIKSMGGPLLKGMVDKIGKSIETTNKAIEKNTDLISKNTEMLTDMVKTLSAPKRVVFDKDGMPVGIEPDRKLN